MIYFIYVIDMDMEIVWMMDGMGMKQLDFCNLNDNNYGFILVVMNIYEVIDNFNFTYYYYQYYLYDQVIK